MTAKAHADTSTPRGAAEAFFKALEGGDVKAARELTVGEEKHYKMLDLLVPMVGGFKKLEASAVKKWGEDGKKLLANDQGGGSFDIGGELKNAKEEIASDGNSATITPEKKEGKPNEPVKLKKVEGKWKIDLASMPSEGMDDPNAAKVIGAMGGVAKDLAAEIDADKYKTVEEAKKAFGEKMLAVMLGAAGGAAPQPQK